MSEISNGDARSHRDAEGQATPPWDVIVIGAGPGGSSAAATLAKGGARVLVLEREEFPRFHVGESLLPDVETIIRLLDIDLDPEVFIYKGGAQFLCEETGRKESFDFAEALPGPQRHAWHVDRPKFDNLLRDGAVAAGAVVRHGISVEDVEIEESGVRLKFEAGEEMGRYLIDATGLDRFLAKKMQSGRPYEKFGKAAAFTHFSDLSEDALAEFAPKNDVRIIVVPDGWLWAIPMTSDRLSIGLVSRLPGLRKQHLHDYLAQSPLFRRLLAGATHGETRLMGNFSFENIQSTGARFACVGDAACFIDPVFSSGVSLAIHRGIETAECLLPALAEGREGDPDLMEPMKATMQRAYDTFAGLVYRFYNTNFVDNIIFGAPKEGQFRDGVISVLAGDVFRTDNPFQEMLLKSKRHSIRSSNPGKDPGKDQGQGHGSGASVS